MKDKNLAGILALFFGFAGVHRFYLGQVGLGILYIFLMPIAFAISFFDAIAFFVMDEDKFNLKYNREHYELVPRQRRQQRAPQRPVQRNAPPVPPRQQRKAPVSSSPAQGLKQQGIQKYKDYDYLGAINDFKEALRQAPRDISLHFNLACAYSLTEQADEAFFHLDQAVALGFNDFKRIREHEAFAFLRIQDKFEAFEAQGFRLNSAVMPSSASAPTSIPQAAAPGVEDHSDLLDQLKKLNDLREKGLLTAEEFDSQKKKLMS